MICETRNRRATRRWPACFLFLFLFFFLVLSLIPPGGTAVAQDRDAHPTDPSHRVLATAVQAALPGATMDWDTPAIIFPDGTSERVEMGCYREATFEGREVVALSFQFPDRTRAAAEKSISVADAVAGGREARIAVVTLDVDGTPADARVTFLEPAGRPASCGNLEFTGDSFVGVYGHWLEGLGELAGPLVEVEFSALYMHGGQLASMVWGGLYDAAENRYRLLVPAGVSLESGEMEMFQLLDAPEPGLIRLEGMVTGKTWTFRCPGSDTCLVPPEEALSWLGGR